MTVAYIAGAMSGQPGWGFDLFDAAAECLSEYGWTVFSPADMDRAAGMDPNQSVVTEEFIAERFREDMIAIGQSDAIVLLENWTRSRGARHEAQTALFCGQDFYLYLEDEDCIISVNSDEIRAELAKPMPEAPPPPPPVEIGLGHYARVGKDEVADYLVERYGFQKQGYTDAINEILYATCEGIATIVDEVGWERSKDEQPWVRGRQQALGTIAREVLGESVWVDAVARKWRDGGRYVIKNVRFPNEAETIQAVNGKVFRVDRPGYGPVNDHISEKALADWAGWDAVINNHAGLAELHAAADTVMALFGIDPID